MLEYNYRRRGRRVPNICSGCGVHAVYPTALEIKFDQQGYGWRAALGFEYIIYLELGVAVGAKGWESNLQVLVSILRVQRRNTWAISHYLCLETQVNKGPQRSPLWIVSQRQN